MPVCVCSHRGFWDGRDEAPRGDDPPGPQLRRQPGGPHVHPAPRHQHQQPVEAPRRTGQEVLPAGGGEGPRRRPVWTDVQVLILCSPQEEDGAARQAPGQDGAAFKAPAPVKTKASSLIINSLITSKFCRAGPGPVRSGPGPVNFTAT